MDEGMADSGGLCDMLKDTHHTLSLAWISLAFRLARTWMWLDTCIERQKSILIPVEYLVAACRSKHTLGTLCNRELFRVGGEVAEVAMRCFSERNLSVMKWGGGPAKMGHLRPFPIQMALSSQRPPLKLKSPSLNLRVLVSLPPHLGLLLWEGKPMFHIPGHYIMTLRTSPYLMWAKTHHRIIWARRNFWMLSTNPWPKAGLGCSVLCPAQPGLSFPNYKDSFFIPCTRHFQNHHWCPSVWAEQGIFIWRTTDVHQNVH